jgi:amino acid adenylation domain-containing protein
VVDCSTPGIARSLFYANTFNMCTEQWLVKLCSGLHITVLREISLALQICTSNINFQSSFIENGGDSLSCLSLQSALKNIGIDLTFETILTIESIYDLLRHDAASKVEVNDIGTTKSMERRLSGIPLRNEDQGWKRWRRQSVVATTRLLRNRSITSLSREGHYPMTDLQLAFVHSSLGQPTRNVIQYREVHWYYNVARLKQAWGAVMESEAIFQMRFQLEEGSGWMVETGNAHFEWFEVNVDTDEQYDQELEQEDWGDELQNGFPVNSFKVVSWNDKSTVTWRVHHVLIDEYSRNLVLSKVRRHLVGYQSGKGPSFGSFAAQLRLLQCRFQDAGKAYWADQQHALAAAATTLQLPAPASVSPKALHHFEVHFETQALVAFCQHTNITLASLYYAAWALALTKFVDSNSVCFGAVFSGRSLGFSGIEDTIGPTISSLPLQVQIDGNMKVGRWLHRVFDHVTKLSSFQWSAPDKGITPQFDTALNVQITSEAEESTPFGPIEPPVSTILSDIPLQVDIARSGKVRFSYHTDAYSAAQIATVAETFLTTLAALRQCQTTVDECLVRMRPDVYQPELRCIGNWKAATTRDASIRTDLVQLFRQAASTTPSGIAVSQGSKTLTYAELDQKSSVVAERLAQIIAPEDVVCVLADRSVYWIVALYGVLKAGGIYCPLAEDMPAAVKTVNCQNADAKMFLVGTTAAKAAKPPCCSQCLSVEEILSDTTGRISVTMRIGVRPNAPAYLCFTSGSTGKPKGVLCRHRGLVAFQSDLEVRLFARPDWKIAQVMSPSFDGSIHEIFSALSYGAQLVLKDNTDPLAHIKAADAALLTPSVAKALDPLDYPNLKLLYLVGEAVPQAVCDAWAAGKALYNMYGPTEATCGATIKRLRAHEPVTLGAPNTTSRIYILDGHQRVVPRGVVGEIYLAGVQVAAGYFGQPEETAKRFLQDTVHPHLEEQMYRTGDRGYWNESGELMFLGRNDRQIKLRGFRIDMDDLEVQMLQCYPAAKGVAVTLKDNSLVAQVQPANIDVSKFRDQIRKHVPAYALPEHVLPVNEFPLTPVGKLDYKTIAEHADSTTHVDRHQTVHSASEKIVTTAVRNVLGLAGGTNVDLDSSFTDLGGHSVLHITLSHRLSRCFGRWVPLELILQAPSLRDLATSINVLKAEDAAPDEGYTIPYDDSRVSPIEMDWWNKYQNGGSPSFNVSYACELGLEIDVTKMVDAWNTVLTRHKILRSYYQPCEDFGARRRYHKQPPRVERVDAIDITQELHMAMDIRKDYLVRTLVSPTHMLVVIGHIICDLTTLRILLDEVTTAYLGRPLTPIGKSYSQAQWSIPTLACHFPFWTEYLADRKNLEYPVGINKSRSTWDGTSHVWHIPADIYTRLRNLSTVEKVTMHQLSLAAVALALQHRSETCDVTLGAPYLNRNSEDDQNVVGLFLEPLPIRIRYDAGHAGEESFIQAVQQSSRAALSHTIPWHQLLTQLNIIAEPPNHPVFDIMVTFHDKKDSVDFGTLDTKPISTWTEGAKFKIMAEFTADRKGRLDLRLEYSTECFEGRDIKLLAVLIDMALDGLARKETYNCIRKRLESRRVKNPFIAELRNET